VIANILEAAAAKNRAPDENDRETQGRQIVILPTGAGKSLCFQLPAMLLSGPTLVIYPILSLMADQERSLKERGFEPVLLRGGQAPEERKALWEKVRRGQSRFIIANPEVLLSPRVKKELESLGLAHLVIDEAHCVSEWGESFRPGYLRIGEIISAAGKPLVTAFTATASAAVLEKIETYIFNGPVRRVTGNPDRGNIAYAANGAILKDLAVRDLVSRRGGPVIVFCSSRRGTERLARYLGFFPLGREIRFYHAGLSREEKTAAEQWFFKSPDGILTATCAYGMGVDKADIRTVIHRDCPPSVEAYLQESGRAGRDGLPSSAVLLWGPDDERALGRAQTGAERQRLAGLMAYSRNTEQCRREQLLGLLDYEGETNSPEIRCCDVCSKEAKKTLREEPSLTDFFRRNRRVYTLSEAAAFLSRAGGGGTDWSAGEAGTAIRELIRQQKLKVCRAWFWKGKIYG
jgi:ATP-dependent DNA helicase RecQ